MVYVTVLRSGPTTTDLCVLVALTFVSQVMFWNHGLLGVLFHKILTM